MNIFDLQATISLNTDSFVSGVRTAQSAFDGLGNNISAVTVAIGTALGNMATKAAGALVDLAKDSVNTGMEFGAAMSNVKAISGATEEEFEALRDKAKEMGATTKFTATEAAEAFSYMAMAGWDAESMLNGIGGVMNLAAASGESLATTSDIVTDALTAFGLSAEDAGHFADVLAAASSAANTNVSMMGETFKYVAPVAGTLGYSVEDLATVIGIMANSGIKAGQAGTALRASLTRLVNPTDQVAVALSDLGLEGGVLTDADGNMLSFAETVNKLREAFAGLSEAEQAQYAATIFGQEAMSGMLAIINASEGDYTALAEEVSSASEAMGGMGAAAEMAGVQIDNLKGDMTLLESAFDGFKVAISEKLDAPLREFAQMGASIFSDLTAAINEGGLKAAFESLGSIISKNVGPKFKELVDSINPLKDSLGGDFPAIIQAAAGGIKALVESFQNAKSTLIEKLAVATEQFFESVRNASVEQMGIVTGLVTAFIESFQKTNSAATISKVSEKTSDLFATFLSVSASTISAVSSEIAEFTDGFKDGGGADALAKVAQSAGDLFAAFLEASESAIKGVASGVKEFLKGFDSETVGNTIAEVAKGSADLFSAIATITGDAIRDVADGINAFAENADLQSAGEGISNMAVAIGKMKSAVDEMITNRVRALGEAFKGMGERVGEAAGKFGPDVGRLGMELGRFTDLCTEACQKIEAVFAPVVNLFNHTLAVALESCLKVASALVGAIIDAITPLVSFFNDTMAMTLNAFKGNWSDAWSDAKNVLQDSLDFFKGLADLFVRPFQSIAQDMWQAGQNLVNGLKNGIASAWGDLTKWIGDKVSGLVTFVEDLLGIASPSRVFAGIGKNLVLGMKSGWVDSFDNLEKQVARDISEIGGTAKVGFEESAIGRSSAAGISSLLTAGDIRGSEMVSINLILDGEVAATALYDPLRRTAFQKGQGAEVMAYA